MKLDNIHEGQALRIAMGIMVLGLLLADGAGAATLTVNAIGGADYTKIQDAINNASDGDTILVYSGTYYEQVNVNKQLILQGIDTGSGKPVVNADGIGSAITLSAGNNRVEGFTAINGSDAGIYIISNNNSVRNNTANSNKNNGIYLYHSNDNSLSGNNASNNNFYGIFLDTSLRNTLTGNIATSNVEGINLGGNLPGGNSFDNMLVGNKVSNNNLGIHLVHHAQNNSLIGNNASNNAIGIDLENQCQENSIIYNNVSNNIDGISIDTSWNNTLSGNFVTENNNGIILYSDDGGSNGNHIYNNYFKNTNNAIDENTGREVPSGVFYGNNTWNTTKITVTNIIGGSYLGGNFWANPSGTGFSQNCIDANGDGFCDLPYVLDANHTDYLPLTDVTGRITPPLLPPPPVPELPTIVLMGTGMLGLLFVVKKKK